MCRAPSFNRLSDSVHLSFGNGIGKNLQLAWIHSICSFSSLLSFSVAVLTVCGYLSSGWEGAYIVLGTSVPQIWTAGELLSLQWILEIKEFWCMYNQDANVQVDCSLEEIQLEAISLLCKLVYDFLNWWSETWLLTILIIQSTKLLKTELLQKANEVIVLASCACSLMTVNFSLVFSGCAQTRNVN